MSVKRKPRQTINRHDVSRLIAATVFIPYVQTSSGSANSALVNDLCAAALRASYNTPQRER
jgi:hypothetical protein